MSIAFHISPTDLDGMYVHVYMQKIGITYLQVYY
jgi:hypothetical protein